MVNDFDKYIYNTYLKVSRSSYNTPYKTRKDFDTLDDEKFVYLKKLSNFFTRNKEIKPEEFFKASFQVYSDSQFLDLKYFTSLKASKAYTIVQKRREKLDPDEIEQLAFTKDSLVFIRDFCKTNSINVEQYIHHTTNNICTFLLHLKERNINIYALFGFLDFERNYKKADLEITRFMLGEDFSNNFSMFKVKFLNSNKCRILVEEGLKKIKN
jgi:hypothetical protein